MTVTPAGSTASVSARTRRAAAAAAPAARRRARAPGPARSAPAPPLAVGAAERVEEGVDVERYGLHVSPDVRDHGHAGRVDDFGQRAHEAGAPDAAGEHGDLHRAGAASSASAAAVFGPSRSSSRIRSSVVSTSAARFGI